MSVHRLKDGRWICKYQDRKTGKDKKEYFGRGLEAEKKARQKNESLNLRSWKRRTPEIDSHTFSELANTYGENKVNDMSDISYENWLYKMESIIFPELGHLQAIRISPRIIDLYVRKRIKAGVKKTTIHRELSDIQAVLNWSVERKYLIFNPIKGYKKPKRDDAIILPPSISELNSILKHSPDHLKRALCLSYYTGLRPGRRELFQIHWDDIDFDSNIMLIRSAKKGGPRSRLVPIHPEFLIQLSEWKKSDMNKPDYIIRWRNKPIQSIKSAFRSAKKKAGISRRLRPYDLRHAFASMMLKSGADLKSTSELIGHSRPDTTTRIYQHTDFKMHRQAILRLPSLDPVTVSNRTRNRSHDMKD